MEGVTKEHILDLTIDEFMELLKGDKRVDETEISSLLDQFGEIVGREPNVLYLDAPITVCGDIHGQMLDLFKLFDEGGRLDKDPNVKYLFLGDYVDRGYSSLETFAFLAYLKVKYPRRIYILRGNHESRQVNQMYGLFNDCMNLYGHSGIWFHMNEIFDLLPISAVIDHHIFCVHGGLSPRITRIEQIAVLDRKKDIEDGAIADLTWSDPEEGSQSFMPNRRGNGYTFGAPQTKMFLRNNGMYKEGTNKETDPDHGFIARSHQVAMAGFQWFHDDRLVIVWSAPNYTYKQGNEASIMKVMPGMPVQFTKFKEDPNSSQKPGDVFIEYFA